MAGARGSANGSATAGRGARVLERADASAAAAGDDGASADGEPRGRLNGKPRSGGGHAQARVPALAGARTLGSARTLTIGEAAARLAVEFPGMTVAVLRRLEAGGKFTPGRSSSGYRRYSETDLDLIRIVLADQPIGEEAVPAQSGPAYQADPADMSGAESPLAHPGVYAPGTAQAYASSTAAQRPAAARTTARAARVPSSRVPAARPAASSRTQAPAIATLFDVASGAAPNGRVAVPPPAAEAVTAARPASTRTDSPRAVPAQSASAPAQSPSTRRADRRWPDADFFTPDLGEVSLDRDQLAAAARTDREWIDGLMEYGVLAATDAAGGADLLVAKASAELAQFGVEPRHLRAVAASAARVAELIAAATSSGSGRDSARRERAILAAPNRSAEAAAAAVRLHAALVRAALLRG
jgi:hypothetical protein